jgi:hypothetical protein
MHPEIQRHEEDGAKMIPLSKLTAFPAPAAFASPTCPPSPKSRQ